MGAVTINIPTSDYFANEAYKALRTNIIFCGKDKQVITITSFSQGEGKSTTVINLARALAEVGKKVLIIDADLRKSSLIAKLKAKGFEKGLSHYLSQQNNLEEVICQTNINNLDIIFSGPVPPNPAELLGVEVFSDAIKQVKENYDYVLIDTPPIGTIIDACVVASNSDGSVIVIESGAVSYRDEQEIKKQLEKSGSPILGVILNKVEYKTKGYYKKYVHK